MDDYFENDFKLRKVKVTRKDVLNNGTKQKLSVLLILAFCHPYIYITYAFRCHLSLFFVYGSTLVNGLLLCQ